MVKKVGLTETFKSADGQGTVPDVYGAGSSDRPADRHNGEGSYADTTKSEVMAKIMHDLQARTGEEVLDIYKSLGSTTMAPNVRPADKTSGETKMIRLSATAVSPIVARESVQEIFAGSELSEEILDKATNVFEAATNARIAIAEAKLEEDYAEALSEAVSVIVEDITSKVDKYITYVAEQFVEANVIAIDNGIKVDMAESFIHSLKTLFTDNYFNISEEKVDLIDSMISENTELKSRLNSSIEAQIALSEELESIAVKNLVIESAEGLTLSQKDKFFTLVENISYEDLSDLDSKIQDIKSTYFTQKPDTARAQPLNESFEGETEDTVSPDMSPYIAALKRTSLR